MRILGQLPLGLSYEDLDGFGQLLHGVVVEHAAEKLELTGLAECTRNDRIYLPEPLRQYVRDKLTPEPNDRMSTLGYFCALATLGNEIQTGRASEWRDKLAVEFDNIEAVLSKAVAESDPCDGLRKVVALGRELFQHEALESSSDRKLLLTAIAALGRFQRFSGIGATTLLEQALDDARKRNEPLHAAECYRVLGVIMQARTDPHGARDEFLAARKIYEQLAEEADRRVGIAHSLCGLAETERLLNREVEARERFEEAKREYERAGAMPGNEHRASLGYGNTLRRPDEITKGKAACLERLAGLDKARMDYAEARKKYEQALHFAEKIGDDLIAASCKKGFADLDSDMRGNFPRAEKYYQDAQNRFEKIGFTRGEADCLYSLGDLFTKDNRLREADGRYASARERYQKGRCDLGEANCLCSLSDIVLAREQTDEQVLKKAANDYRTALDIFRRYENCIGVLNC